MCLIRLLIREDHLRKILVGAWDVWDDMIDELQDNKWLKILYREKARYFVEVSIQHKGVRT